MIHALSFFFNTQTDPNGPGIIQPPDTAEVNTLQDCGFGLQEALDVDLVVAVSRVIEEGDIVEPVPI